MSMDGMQTGMLTNIATDQPTQTPKQLMKLGNKPKVASRSEFLKTLGRLQTQQTPTNSGYSP